MGYAQKTHRCWIDSRASAFRSPMCPLSNVKLKVFQRIEDHNLKRLLQHGLMRDGELR